MKFQAFSLGMKQRLAIASALLNNPEMLILDEPTNGLDPQGIHHIREIIKGIAERGTTILLASHLLSEVEKTCSDILIIRNGKLLHQGSVADLQSGSSYIEVQCAEEVKLLECLRKHPDIKVINDLNKPLYRAYFNRNLPTNQLNKYLADNNIYVSHLVERKTNLEEYFLELTNTH